MLSSRLQWAPNLAVLSRRLRPVMFELWGHGRSPAPVDDACYCVDALIEQLELAREAMHESKVVLMGQSFGAGLAFQYALRHPHRVQAIVFTNSSSAFGEPDDASMKASRQSMAEAISLGGASSIRELPMHPRHGNRLPAALKSQLIAAADAVAPVALERLFRITAPDISVAHELHRIACPVLLVNGRYETRFQPHRDLAQTAIQD
jgi:pimeloyl-ACP methyl ester carboxylesterase